MNIPQQFHKLYHTMNPDIQISLAKPNKQIIGNLSEAYNISGIFKLGQINELSFSIPYYVEKNFIKVKNKNVDKIKQRYLLKVKYLGKEEWFIIVEETDDLKETNIKHVTAYSLGYQLTDKYIRQWAGAFVNGEYRKESLNAKQVMDTVLSETSWKYNASKSDSLFMTRYRAFDFAGVTKLESVFTIAETFNAVIEWDTHNKEIIFHDAEKYGAFRGLYVSDDRYLSSYEKVTKSDEMTTRLKLYGKDGLTINEINPIGTDYIEDLSYFLRGFSMNTSGIVTSHSEYVSDELCKAIINYQKNVSGKQGQFASLLSQKTNLESQLKDKEDELFDLENELKAIQVDIDFAESQKQDATTYKTQESTKKSQITSKENEIVTINSNINNVNSQLNTLKNQISMQSNFTQSQLEELDSFIIEKTWENENITTAEELMELGRKELDKMNKPSSTYNIGLVYLLRVAEAQKDVKKLLLGDKIKINKREMDETVEAQLVEMNIDFDDRSIDLTIANFSTNSDEDELAKLLYKTSVATSTINLNKSKWDDISNLNNQVEMILNNSWDSAKREIIAGAEQNTIIDSRGITTIDMVNPNKFIRILGGVLGMTDDGGQTFKTAITPTHIVAEQIQGRLLVGQELYMENEAGKFRFDQDGVTVKGTSLNVVADDDSNLVDYWNSVENKTKEYADGLRSQIDNEISDINIALTNLDEEIKGSFADGIISEAEAKSLGVYINILENEKADLDKRYNLIYNDADLSLSVKTQLKTSKDNYDIIHESLKTLINNSISDGIGTTGEKNAIDSKYSEYRTKLVDLNNNLDIAISNIEDNKNSGVLSNAKSYTDQELGNYVTASLYQQDLSEIQAQIDGAITTWFYSYEPNLTNLPASEWRDNATKNVHLGDLFYNTITGYAYRFTLDSGSYKWVKITDTDVTKALQDASKAQDTADQKRRTFVSQPSPPYDVGDLWVQGLGGDILRCKVSKMQGQTYVSSDWEIASKYTDDTRAIEAEKNAKKYADDLKNIMSKEISDVNTSLTNLNTEIKGTFKDGVISQAEAISLSKYINTLNSEKEDLDSRYNLIYNDIQLSGAKKSTLKTKKDAYNTAHTNLISAINTAITDGKATSTESANVDSKFTAYKTSMSQLSTAFDDAINVIAQAKADKAKSDANTFTSQQINLVKTDISDVNTKITNLQDFSDSAFADGIITFAEKESFKMYLKQLETEKVDIDNKYASIYADTFLTGTSKSNLQTAKVTNYDVSHTDLVNYINSLITATTQPSDAKTVLDTKFTNYKNKLATLSTRFEEAIRSIEQAKADKAKKDAQDSSVQLGKNYNNVVFDANSGIVVTRTDGKVKSTFNATDGILVETKKGTTWNKEFWYDPLNERLVVDGEIHARDLRINGNSVLVNNKISGTYITNLNADTITSGKIKAIDIEGSTITGSSFIGGSLNIGNGNFTVDSLGKLIAKSAEISGLFSTYNSSNKEVFSVKVTAYNNSQLLLSNPNGETVLETSTYNNSNNGGLLLLSTASNYYNRASTVTIYSGYDNTISSTIALREKERAYTDMISLYVHNTYGGIFVIKDIGDVNNRLVDPRTYVQFRKGSSYINDNLAIGKTYASYKLDVSGDIRATTNMYIGSKEVATKEYVDQAIATAIANNSTSS